MLDEIYKNGTYFKNNPTWDVEESPWKAKQIMRMMERNDIAPRTICEVGCGAGGILAALQRNMDKACVFWGYEISPQAFEICKKKENDRLHFKVTDILSERDIFFDLILLIDVLEHLEDYFHFLREIKRKSTYKIFHIPLDISVQSVFRQDRILRNREGSGHLHYFTKDTAMRVLKDAGYEIIDFFYTAQNIELPVKTLKSRLAKWPRKMFFAINKDLAVRLLGGYSLLVLAK